MQAGEENVLMQLGLSREISHALQGSRVGPCQPSSIWNSVAS